MLKLAISDKEGKTNIMWILQQKFNRSDIFVGFGKSRTVPSAAVAPEIPAQWKNVHNRSFRLVLTGTLIVWPHRIFRPLPDVTIFTDLCKIGSTFRTQN